MVKKPKEHTESKSALENRQLYANDEATVDDFNDLQNFDNAEISEIMLYQNKEILTKLEKLEKLEGDVIRLRAKKNEMNKAIDKLNSNLDHHRYVTHDKAVQKLKDQLNCLESALEHIETEQCELKDFVNDWIEKLRDAMEKTLRISEENFQETDERLKNLEESVKDLSATNTKSEKQCVKSTFKQLLESPACAVLLGAGLALLTVTLPLVLMGIGKKFENPSQTKGALQYQEPPHYFERKVTFSDLKEVSEELSQFKDEQEVLNRDFAKAVEFVNSVKNLVADEIAVSQVLEDEKTADSTEEAENTYSKSEIVAEIES